jgi:hypothetical protein
MGTLKGIGGTIRRNLSVSPRTSRKHDNADSPSVEFKSGQWDF